MSSEYWDCINTAIALGKSKIQAQEEWRVIDSGIWCELITNYNCEC